MSLEETSGLDRSATETLQQDTNRYLGDNGNIWIHGPILFDGPGKHMSLECY